MTPAGDLLITEHDAGFVRVVRRVEDRDVTAP